MAAERAGSGCGTSAIADSVTGFPAQAVTRARRRACGDDAERRRLLKSAEQMLLDDHAIVPLHFMTNKHLVSGRISGYQPNALDRHPSRYVGLSGR